MELVKAGEGQAAWTDELERCETCRFYRPAENDKGEIQVDQAGACRYNPPVLFMLRQPAHPSGLEISGRQVIAPAQTEFMTQFPPVMPGAGCGKHEPRGAKK